MFERFRQRYIVTSQLSLDPPGPFVASPLEDTPGYKDFLDEYAGATFNQGVYRVHPLGTRERWASLITEMFPKYRSRFSVFGYDWMGRQFALDFTRRENGQPLVMIFDPGFDEILEVPESFLGFHDRELVEHSDAALLDNVFEEWLRAGERAPSPTECVGYEVPLFLGGVDKRENYGLTDMEVYWSITAQLLDQTRDLPDGTPVGRVKIE